jgi:hypothetical protein
MPYPAIIVSSFLLACSPAYAGYEVSFRREVVPILTKSGCNAGTCHGTPTGKNGFKLSLRGYDPVADLSSLTHDQFARRIDRLNPAASLILIKGSGRTAHEGGKRIDPDGPAFKSIEKWIATGSKDDLAEAPLRLTITPSRAILERPDDERPFRVVAAFASDTERDVTHLVRFSTTDDSVARVTPDGIVRGRNRGEATVVAEYMGVMATASVIVRDPTPLPPGRPFPANNFIDTIAFAKWNELRIEPSDVCPDEAFVRRAHLDAIGRLPTPERVRTFLGDRSPDKRGKLIDELLGRPEFADWWGLKWADRLGVNQRFVGKNGATKYFRWVRDRMARNEPEDSFVRDILTATGGNYSHPPAGFYRRLRDPMTRAEEVSQLFLGVRIGCAKCHNHPGERWTQDDYAGLAAFFSRLTYRDGPFFIEVYDKEETVLATRTGELVHPRTGRVTFPKFLGGETVTAGDEGDRREAFARWLTAPENPFFAKAAANRIWFHLFGRGLVEPVDDFRVTNPASHPELLERLAAELVVSNYDRKHLIRTVMNSRTYQLSSETTPTNRDDDRFFSHAPIRRLGAEQLLDAISDACWTPSKFAGLPLGTPAAAVADGEFPHPFLTAFGRPARAMACECEREADTTLSQALHLGGGRSFHSSIRHPDGRIATLLAKGKTDAEIVEELFLATLARVPTLFERAAALKRFPVPESPARRAVVENLLHALINHPEFVFQH